MKKTLRLLLSGLLTILLAGCAFVPGAAVNSVQEVRLQETEEDGSQLMEPVFETSFSRFDDRHERHDYHFMIFQNTYGEYVLKEDAAVNAGEVVNAEIFEKIREIIDRNALEQYDGRKEEGSAEEQMSLTASFDAEHPLQFTLETDPYAVWTEELLNLFTETLQSYEAPVAGIPQLTLAESLCGRYLYTGGSEDTDRVYEVFLEDGQLYVESRSIYDYWGAEFVPDNPEDLYASAGTSLTGTWYQFSGFSLAGSYWNGGTRGTLEKSADGIVVNGDPFGEGEHLILVRDETALPIHHTQERAESFDEKLVGMWRAGEGEGALRKDIFIRVERSGDVCMVEKQNGLPVTLLRGVILEGENGVLRFGTERFGYGGMPFTREYRYKAASTMLELETIPEYDTDEPKTIKLYPTQAGERDEEISNGAGEGVLSELYIINGFLDFDGSYQLINADGEVFRVDDSSVLAAGEELPGYMAGDTAMTWVERMGDPLNPYTSIVGFYTVQLSGAHVDFIYGFGW